MQETGSRLISRRSIIDEAFSVERPEAHELFLFIDDEEFSYAIAERQNKMFVALESWNLPKGEAAITECLKETFETSPLLSSGKFRKVICCTGFRNSALIPTPLYDPYSAEDQLRFANAVNKNEEIMTDELRQIEARNVFSIPSWLHNIVATWFQNAEFHHTSTSLVECLISLNKNASEEIITVNAHFTYIEVIVTRGKELLFYNSFDYASAEEMIYYILFICEQLQLNPENVDLRLSGEIDLHDEAFQLASKYIRNVNFTARPDNYSYSDGFDNMPSQFHFNLFTQLVCVS